MLSIEDLFKGKPAPVLPRIRGIPLPEDEGEFFEDIPEEEIELPENSKLSPKDLQNRPDDPKLQTRESDSEEDDGEEKKESTTLRKNLPKKDN